MIMKKHVVDAPRGWMGSLEQKARIPLVVTLHYTGYAGFAVDGREDSACPRNH